MPLRDQTSRSLRRRAILIGGLGATGALIAACQGAPSTPSGSAPTAPAAAVATPGQASPAPTSAALGTPRPTVAATAAPVTTAGKLTLTTDVNVEGIPLVQQVADRWNKANPATPVDAQTITSTSYLTKVLTMAAGGVLSDVFAITGQDLPNLANRNVTLKLDSALKSDAYDLSDFLPLPRDRMRWKGATIAMPRGFSNQCVYCNLDLFDKGGVARPPTDWNAARWDFAQFLDTCRKLTKGSGADAQYAFAVTTDFVGGWGQWILTNGGRIFDDGLTTCLVDQPPAVEALQFLQDLIVKEKVAPTPAVLQTESAQSLFLTGRLAMLFAPVAATITYRKAKFTWDLAVNPKGKGSRLSTAAAGAYWCGNAKTAQPELTWKLLAFLSTRESEDILATTYFPARESSLQDFAKVDPNLPPAHRQVGIEGQKRAQAFPATPDYAQLTDIIQKQLAYIWDGSQTAATATKNATADANAYLKSHPQSS